MILYFHVGFLCLLEFFKNFENFAAEEREKGESQDGGNKKITQANFFRKTNIYYPLIYVCVSGGNKCSFFRKFDVLCFLVVSVLRLALLLYYNEY